MATYTLSNISDIMVEGFEFSIPEVTINLIMSLSSQVGSPEYIKTPSWSKNNNKQNVNVTTTTDQPKYETKHNANKKRRGNKGMEIDNDDEWNSVRSFQVTKIEKKEGIDGKIDQLRLLLNKITDKTFFEIKEKVVNFISDLSNVDEETMLRVANMVFDILSSNKFYSKIYCELYCNLIINFPIFLSICNTKYETYLSLFDVIEYVDPNVDYDKFCENNKLNDKRRSLSEFLLNLARNNILTNTQLVNALFKLIQQLMIMTKEDNKKSEVEELTENIAILYDKKILTNFYDSKEESRDFYIDGMNILELFHFLAKSKTKDFKSISNKVIFKFMDLIEM